MAESQPEPGERLAVHKAAVDEMVLPKISAGAITTETAMGEFLMSPAVKGTLKLIAELEDEKFIDTYRQYLKKYSIALEAKKRFDEAAVAIERRIESGDASTLRVLDGLMSAHECDRAEAKKILLSKTREILRVKVEAAAAEQDSNGSAPIEHKRHPSDVVDFHELTQDESVSLELTSEDGGDSPSTAGSPQRRMSNQRRSSSSSVGGGPASLYAMLRTAVSKKKKRFVDEKFNLDLSYIPLAEGDSAPLQIVSMGFPCQGSEKMYRNPYREVLQFFEERHGANYILFNLCSERKYEPESFTEAGTCCGVNMAYRFHDHNPPPLGYFGPFCQDVDQFISQGPHRVAAVHCKAGKGRTGTMIVAFLACKLRLTIPEAMDHFSTHRTMDGKGVTIPSQKRFLYYFGKILDAALAGDSVGVGDNAGRSGLGGGGAASGAEPQAKAEVAPSASAEKNSKEGTKREGGYRHHFFESLPYKPLLPFFRSLLPPVQPVLLMSISFLGIPSMQGGGFTPYFVIENNAWQEVGEKNDKVYNVPTWVLSSKQMGLPSNFVKSEAGDKFAKSRRRSAGFTPRGGGEKLPPTRSLSADQADQRSAERIGDSIGTKREVEVLTLELPEPVEIVNEVRLTVYHKNQLRQKVKMFSFWFHTGFLERKTIFSKIEVDGAHKDKKHKVRTCPMIHYLLAEGCFL